MGSSPGDFNGPLSADDLLAIWTSAVDSSYSQPISQAGDGGGMEVYGQAFAQLARVSEAIDVSTQAMFILPFSGQTSPPADGPQQATVVLTLTRSGFIGRSLVLQAGAIWVDESATDSGANGGVAVDTGRRYQFLETVVFLPGEPGPLTVTAIAEKPGYGYNNPLPGAISIIEEVGADFTNDLTAVVVVPAPAFPASATPASTSQLWTQNIPDTFVPGQIGAYVELTAGANAGSVGRIVSFTPPDPSAVSAEFPNGVGSVVGLELLASVSSSSAAALLVGEPVTLGGATTGRGLVVEARARATDGTFFVAFVLTQGSVAVGTTVTGDVSTATVTAAQVYESGAFAAEAPSAGMGGATWRMLSWSDDWGLISANELSPSGGVAGLIDLLGADRGIPRSPNEPTEAYRLRISQIADVVTPNAIRRALNRSIAPVPWCFREVGSELLPGFFYDRVGDENGDFYDWGTLRFTGTYAGDFNFQEPVKYVRGVSTLGVGYWGSILVPFTVTLPSGYAPASIQVQAPQPVPPGTGFSLVLTRAKFDLPIQTIEPQAGDVIVGQETGATFTPTAAVTDPLVEANRNHVWLDYTEFRGFFAVEVPPLTLGEFGFGYDDGGLDAYDSSPFLSFYDGYPAGDVEVYGQAFAAVERVRMGGVGWQLVQGDGTCD
jgi:hypothetical protein